MGLTIAIGGSDVSALVETTSLTISQVLTRRGDTARFRLLDPTRGRAYSPLQPVRITDELGNVKFAGVLTRLRQATPSTTLTAWDLTAQDDTYALQKTLCNKAYQQQPIDAIVKDLLASFPPGAALTTNGVQAGLPTLAYFNVPHLRLADAFDRLVRMANASTFLFWDVDPTGDLRFADQNHVPLADVALVDTLPAAGQVNYRRDTFRYERDATQLTNSITFRGGATLSNPYTQAWVGNGQQTSFGFDYPPNTSSQAGGSLPAVAVNGVAQAIGLDTGTGFGANAALVSVAQGSQAATLRFAAAPASDATITATYGYDLPVLVRRKDNVSVAAFGTWEEYIVDTTVKTQQAATQRAAAMLSQFSRPLATATVDVDVTYRGSLGAGQQVQLVNAQLGLDEALLVTDCTITGQPGGRYAHRLTLAAFA